MGSAWHAGPDPLRSDPGQRSDFFAFYSFSELIRLYPAPLIYDHKTLETVQLGLHGKFLPYLYSPLMLLLVWPLASLSYSVGYALWMGAGMLAYAVTVGFAERNRAAVLAIFVEPSTLQIIM